MTNEECIKMLKSKLDGNTDTSYEWCECVRLAIKALEQQRWIPVSKPPKKNGEYLVTLIDEDSNGDDIFVTDKAYWTGMNWTYKFLIVENVIAYKPLPEPFREESDKSETN